MLYFCQDVDLNGNWIDSPFSDDMLDLSRICFGQKWCKMDFPGQAIQTDFVTGKMKRQTSAVSLYRFLDKDL